jgi:hypothetical protein
MKTLLELDSVDFHYPIYVPSETGRAVITTQYITTHAPAGWEHSGFMPELRPYRLPDGTVVVYDKSGRYCRWVEKQNVRTWTAKKQIPLEVLSASLDAGRTVAEILNPAPATAGNAGPQKGKSHETPEKSA